MWLLIARRIRRRHKERNISSITRQLFTRQNSRVVRAQKISYLRVALNADDVCDGKQFVRFTEIENLSSAYLKARWNSNAYREMAGLIISL